MKKNKYITIKKNDYNRVVLTDVLPYELPFILTNEGFYKSMKNGIIDSNVIYSYFFNLDNDTKPFEYLINRNAKSSRKLYLIHPSNQIKFTKLYNDYKLLITHLCSRSSFSLRSPHSVASIYYEKGCSEPHKDFKDEGVDLSNDNDSPKYASSFFKYKNYDFLYKFYDNYEFHRIERKFQKLFKFDIAKCFDSISTHMLANSLRGEVLAKNSMSFNNFDTTFIKLMESCNFGRMHGLVIGPEFSRIFAEIILQSIDLNIKSALKECDIIEGKDYELRRYVDDYFFFHNDSAIKTQSFEIIKDQLEKFKLYCNESKCIEFSVPFITSVTSAKINIQSQLNQLFDIFSDKEELTPITDESEEQDPHHILSITLNLNRYNLISNRLIRDLKCIINDSNVDYCSVTGYFFTLIKIKSAEIDKAYSSKFSDDTQSEKLCRFILILIELSFFVYAMDLRVRSTYLVSQIVIILNRLSKRLSPEQRERFVKKVYDESNSAISITLNSDSKHHVELLNLIIALKDIDPNYKIPSETLESILGLKTDECDYFRIMVGLYYIRNDKNYRTVKEKLKKIIVTKITAPQTNTSSESTHLYFDSMSTPYLTNKFKSKITKLALNDFKCFDTLDIEDFQKKSSENMWFIDWSKNAPIERLLQKKELRTPYGN
ncbi:RNA-directed DNA polymerase [Shewanella sp. D64]|uniref:antiviral reverse transcriptase Drt3b n=1 Tax=unclassified Shewanella TaxID=196818 RepID=UPI0022BA19C0|nr:MULTISPECIES: antiviral reverse transcriptase Drt3b [unclassified Shewanella]MEC4726551.1 RNA-directed DNA polymerase [Shewanella sp. D64]MEC4737408.1 RNA-directed DNA polymerase [Shewanella sp. E94]WBJ97227.1 RNA-directed DNA polymerase [Shewanella sp. MTB7]